MKRNRILLIVSSLLLVSLIALVTMNFFSRFFGNSADSSKTTVPSSPSHQEDWNVFLSTIDNNKVGSIMVDLGLKNLAPLTSHPNCLRIDVPMRYPSENGLPEQREFQILNDIDEKLSAVLSRKSGAGAVYAGHLYLDGTMYLYYYIPDNTVAEADLSEAMSSFPAYKYAIKLNRDPGWQTYSEFLYPLPIQMQSLHNQKVVTQLRDNGDRLETKRPVRHLIYFKNDQDLERFLASIKGEKFRFVSKENVSDGEYRLLLLIERDDAVDLKSVDEYVLSLWQKAKDANGDYDGWGSSIVKE